MKNSQHKSHDPKSCCSQQCPKSTKTQSRRKDREPTWEDVMRDHGWIN